MTRLYLPITSQPRELDARLLLGLAAVERGMECLIGFKGAFRGEVSALAPGYYLAHTARQNPRNFSILRQFGNRVVVLDEEALNRQSDEIFLKKHRKGAFKDVAHILCWGESDSRIWDRLDEPITCPITAVGNPRIDILRPECRALFWGEADALRQRFGDYVLLNTNFPSVNNITPQGQGVRLADWAMDDRGRAIEAEFLGNKRATFEAMQQLIRPLADAIDPVKLIVRPHPNEQHGPWLAAAKGAENVEVVFEGGVIPWLIGARALIHNNCTTGVESAVAGTPVLNFRPWTSAEYDNPVAHAFGRDCSDVAGLSSAIRDIVSGVPQDLSAAQQDQLRHHILSVDGALSCDRILDLILADLAGKPDLRPRGKQSRRFKQWLRDRRLWLQRLSALWLTSEGRAKRAFLRHAFPTLSLWSLDYPTLGNSMAQFELHMRQFPPFDIEQLQKRVDDIARATGRFDGCTVKPRRDGLVEIRRSGQRPGVD